MLEVRYGDLLNSNANYICHQVNCLGVMGAGVAKQIKASYPQVFVAYKKYCNTTADKRALLGQAIAVDIGEERKIINLFGQYGYGRKRETDMTALTQACQRVVKNSTTNDVIAMPYRIGCGLAGGDWGEVMDMLAEVFRERTLVLYRKD